MTSNLAQAYRSCCPLFAPVVGRIGHDRLRLASSQSGLTLRVDLIVIEVRSLLPRNR
jgi:hypothetical protein